MTIDAGTSLATLVARDPGRALALDRFGLDYCCHGDRSLATACAEAGLDIRTVVSALEATEDVPGHDFGMEHLSPVDLVEHVEWIHHAYLHAELPEVDALAERVLGAHGGRHPELDRVRRLVSALRAELEPHLTREERVLFPAIRQLAKGAARFPFGSIANPIAVMTREHDQAGEILAALRAASGAYTVPADACASYRSLYERLERLERDTHLHVFEENELLFPAARALEDHPADARR